MFQEIAIGTLMALIFTAYGVGMVYFFNRSRWTLEQAIQLSGCPESDLHELIKERMVDYRRKYVVYGPRTFDKYELEQARTLYPEIKRMKAENEARIRQWAEEMAEQNRIYQEQLNMQQEELERMRRIYDSILRDLGVTSVPPKVAEALKVLGLPADASFEKVRKQYRLLTKQYHPDAGGKHEQL